MRNTSNPDSLRGLVDGVFVLSVKTFSDRIAHIRREMGRHGIRFEFIFSHDVADMTREDQERVFGDDCAMRPPHRSLVLKHIEAWKSAARRDGVFLIFEDDVVLHRNFPQKLAEVVHRARSLKPGWLIFLGGADTRVPKSFYLEPGPIHPVPIATADGYLIDSVSARLRLNRLDKERVRLNADHLLKRLDAEIGVAQYWSTTALVEQGSVFGLFESALDDGRRKHSLLFNALRYRWMIFSRRTVPGFFVRLGARLRGATR